ncbi:MAG: sigma-54-dependent transcriptional regulator [Planctomycetaceae bacterium]
MASILVIDDEPTICWGFQQLLSEAGHIVRVAASAEEGLALAEKSTPDAILLDVRLPGMDGLTAIERFRQISSDIPIVLMTAYGSLDTAVRAVASGAVEYFPKPFDLEDAAELIARIVRSGSPTTTSDFIASQDEPDTLIGSSRPMQEVFKQIALAAASDVPVLITGESGTGKELVARAIHQHSARSDRALLPVSVAALSSSVVESELFGHVRGAFTGADVDRPGCFELAVGGTVFLDEIGEIPPAVQVKLLRLLERKEVQRVGDARVRPCDFRVVAATHRDLPERIQAGEFREDLFYRLGVFQIALPPLRERREDLPELARYFLHRATTAERELSFHPDALEALLHRAWRGNVRELRNVVEHAVIVTRGREIGPDAFPEPMTTAPPPPDCDAELRILTRRWTQVAIAAGEQESEAGPLHERLLQLVEPALLAETLSASGGNRAAAAERLGIHRATLRQKLRRYGLDSAAGECEPET